MTPETYTRTPLLKRLPVVAVLALGLAVPLVLWRTWWALVAMLAIWIVGVLVLHLAFHQPLERLLQYREFDHE